jgi:FAD/FMN-containing dehydrogenase
VGQAARAVSGLVARRIVPATLELIDGDCLAAVARYLKTDDLAPPGTGAMLLIEVDGPPATLDVEADAVVAACVEAGATAHDRAPDGPKRDELWRIRRELSPALKTIATFKLNNDVVVPKARVPQLFTLIERLRAESGLPIPAFGHAGDGNIHVNILVPEPVDDEKVTRARAAERALFDGVLALEGSITGEHGIGLTKAKYLPLEVGPSEIALMKRVKAAFDPHGILNPGKIFPEE